MLKGKKILLGITASIAAYKSISLVRLLIKQGAEVKLVLTPSSKDFVSPLVLSTVSRNEVLSELFDESAWANHVMLGRWADLFVVAPLSCNTLAKMATGICDNLLMATYLSATCPVWLAPAMDEDMWLHPATRQNLKQVASYGNRIIPVAKGELASGLNGEGRMAEPEVLLQEIMAHFVKNDSLSGKRALVTAGPTYESLDPVRFIGNYSSGKMGVAISLELAARGAEVALVTGPGVTAPVHPRIHVSEVKSAAEMFTNCLDLFPGMDMAVMAAAVADYTPVTVSPEKIKKKEAFLTIELTKTKDILKALGEIKKEHQYLIGFALETNNEKANALNKLKAKNADMIVLNSMNDVGAGFGIDTNKITILAKDGEEIPYPVKTKTAVAADIVDQILKKMYA